MLFYSPVLLGVIGLLYLRQCLSLLLSGKLALLGPSDVKENKIFLGPSLEISVT
jgi:hypothetical protein